MEVLRDLPARTRGRPSKYDWEMLLDGQVRRLHRDRDFPDVKDAKVFRMMVYTAAQRRDRKATVIQEDADTLVVQGRSA